MPKLKNIRREEFARQYVLTQGNATAAYRETVRRHPRTWTYNSLKTIGCSWAKQPEIVARIEELRETMAKRADITEDKILSDYQWAIDSAKLQAKPEAVTNAATAQAKLVGLLRERVETGSPGAFDKNASFEEILAKVAAEEGPEKARLLAEACDLEYKEEERAAPDPAMDQAPPTDSVN